MDIMFEKGDNVIIKASRCVGTVNDVKKLGETYIYTVTVDGEKRKYMQVALEYYHDIEEDIIEDIKENKFGDVHDLFLFLMYQKFKRPVEGNLYSYLGNKLIFNPFQYKPLLKFLAAGSDERLFIADEVGVGKTIETGIILDELISREIIKDNTPIMIVCPKALCEKWKKEMSERFNLDFYIQESASLNSTLCSILENRIDRPRTIIGLQLFRDKKYIELLNSINEKRLEPYWKMIIIDECHHLRNESTDTNKLGKALSANTEMMLMLSATPLNLRSDDLFNQLNILNPLLFPDIRTFNTMAEPIIYLNKCIKMLYDRNVSNFNLIIDIMNKLEASVIGKLISRHAGYLELKAKISEERSLTPKEVAVYDKMLNSFNPLDISFTRSLKRDVLAHRVTREVHTIPVEYTELEMNFYNTIIGLAKERFLLSGGNPRALSFVTNGLERMAASCIPALKDYLFEIIESKKNVNDENLQEESLDEVNEDIDLTDILDKLHHCYDSLVINADEIEKKDTKYQKFLEFVKLMKEQAKCDRVLVFSFYVKTLKYLHKRLLADGYKVGIIHGEIPMNNKKDIKGRNEIMMEFYNNDIEILLASEVGGEGLDFQFCKAMINYDLPYNPMRIEQRIGRIDRFGQKSDKIFIGSIFVKNTIDEAINEILIERINLAQDIVGDLEPIINQVFTDLKIDMLNGELTSKQIEIRKIELEKTIQLQKKEMEAYEKNRLVLLKDEMYEKEVNTLNNITFITPLDALKLTERFLSTQIGCSCTDINDEESTAKIIISKNVINLIKKYEMKFGNSNSYKELNPFMNLTKSVNVIFDGSKTFSQPNHIFIKPCGAWIKFILNELEVNNAILRSFMLRLKENSYLAKGKYYIYFFDVLFEGFSTNGTIAATVYDANSKKIIKCDSIKLAQNILDYSLNRDCKMHVDCEQLISILDNAYQEVNESLNPLVETMRMNNQVRVQGRIDSLKNTSQSKLARLQESKENHIKKDNIDKDYINMTNGRIEKEKERLEILINKLVSKKELSSSSTLIGVAVVEVE